MTIYERVSDVKCFINGSEEPIGNLDWQINHRSGISTNSGMSGRCISIMCLIESGI